MRRVRVRGLVVAAVAGAVLLTACSGAGNDASPSRSATKAAPAEGAAAAAVPSTSSDVATGVTAAVPTDGRQIVSNATLGLKARRVGEVTTQASAIVTAAGGYLFSENAAVGTRSDAMLVFKVPPTAFATVLEQLGKLGRPVGQQVTTDDVTAQVVDLEGRLASATASAARLRTLFDRADKVADVVAIEGELVKREAEVETLQGQLRVVQAQVALATITVNVAKLVPAPPATEEASGFLAGLGAGWDALVAAAETGATVLGAMLPFLALASLVGGITLVLRRRLRATTPSA